MLWLSRLLYLIPLPFPFPSSLPTSWWEKPPLCGSYKGKKTAHNLRNPVGCVPQSKSESEWGGIPVPVTWSIYYIPAQPQVMIVWTMIQVYELPTKNIFFKKILDVMQSRPCVSVNSRPHQLPVYMYIIPTTHICYIIYLIHLPIMKTLLFWIWQITLVLILQSTLQFENGYCHSTITQLLHPFAMKVSECWRIEQVIV